MSPNKGKSRGGLFSFEDMEDASLILAADARFDSDLN